MKKLISISLFVFLFTGIYAQNLQTTVSKLEKANTIKEYSQLANDFSKIAETQKNQWLPYYYAALCYAKIGWLKQNTDPDNIGSFADKAEQQIKKSQALLDTSTQKEELSEIYCVQMMLNQARVFINPETYGPKYGPGAFNYIQRAKQANGENPRMLYLLGWEKFATPKLFGGDKALAKQLLTQAKQKLEAQPADSADPRWGKKEVDDLLKQL